MKPFPLASQPLRFSFMGFGLARSYTTHGSLQPPPQSTPASSPSLAPLVQSLPGAGGAEVSSTAVTSLLGASEVGAGVDVTGDVVGLTPGETDGEVVVDGAGATVDGTGEGVTGGDEVGGAIAVGAGSIDVVFGVTTVDRAGGAAGLGRSVAGVPDPCEQADDRARTRAAPPERTR